MTSVWLLTSTFYGNWLPGEARGFVGRVWEKREGDADAEARHEHNIPGTPYDEGIPGLREASEVNLEQARALLAQFQETAAIRKWQLLAVAIMANHIHIVAQADAAVDPAKILGDFKAYASRALNRSWGKLQVIPGGRPRDRSGDWRTSRGCGRRFTMYWASANR